MKKRLQLSWNGKKKVKRNKMGNKMEMGGFQDSEFKECVGILVKEDSSLMGMFEVVTDCGWMAAIGWASVGDMGGQWRSGGGRFPGMIPF